MSGQPHLSLIIPTYNESGIIGQTLQEIATSLGSSFAEKTDVIIADDGKDDLPVRVQQLKPSLPFRQIEVLRNSPPLGKGQSIANGFQFAQGEYVGFLDADLSTHPRYILQAMEVLQSRGVDGFIASRRTPTSSVTRKQPLIKTALGDLYLWLSRKIFFRRGQTFSDTQCGFKFFKSKAAKVLFSDLIAKDGLGDLEVLIRANILGYDIHEEGVVWCDTRESKRSLKRILTKEVTSLIRLAVKYGVFRGSAEAELREKVSSLNSAPQKSLFEQTSGSHATR